MTPRNLGNSRGMHKKSLFFTSSSGGTALDHACLYQCLRPWGISIQTNISHSNLLNTRPYPPVNYSTPLEILKCLCFSSDCHFDKTKQPVCVTLAQQRKDKDLEPLAQQRFLQVALYATSCEMVLWGKIVSSIRGPAICQTRLAVSQLNDVNEQHHLFFPLFRKKQLFSAK